MEYISKFGIPLIVASDVNPLPKIVEKIAHSFGTGVYYTEVSLANREKNLIVKKYVDGAKSHEKDALAAGIKAYKSYRQLFIKIQEILDKRGMAEQFDCVVAKILRGESSNIEDAVSSAGKME